MSKILLEDEVKQWDETRCPVCMEHPHNAILLICSSHEKGCRPFMCDTSYRHSNCFDQFRKSFNEPISPSSPPTTLLQQPSTNSPGHISPPQPTTTTIEPNSEQPSEEASPTSNPSQPPCEDLSKLICPLCRGSICGWTVIESVRTLMNAKQRSCSCETCDFSGTYKDLRRHARSVHPLVRPTETDPERQRSWRRLERQRDLGDLLSTLQSSFGGDEGSDETTLTIDDGGWLTVFFLVRFIRTGSPSSGTGGGRTRAQAGRRVRSRLWGESLDGSGDVEDGNGEESSGSGREGRAASRSRRNVRRRLNDRVDEDEDDEE